MSNKKKNRKAAKQKSNSTLLWAGVGIVVLILAILFIQQSDAATASALPLEVSVSEASAKRDAGAFILDVREPEEWNESHIPGATLIPLGDLESRVNEVPKDQEVVVVCRSGNRSTQGRDILLAAGFEQVTSMEGGVNEWKAAGLETVSGP